MRRSQARSGGNFSKMHSHNGEYKPMMDTLEARALLSVAVPTSGSNILPTIPPGSVVVPPTPTPVPTPTPIGIGVTINALAGLPFSGDVGTIKGLKLTATNVTAYQATINWGDGSVVGNGTLTVDSTGVVHVQGTHNFSKAGTFKLVVTVTPKATTTPVAGSATSVAALKIVINSTAIVTAPNVIIHPIAGKSFTGIVGRFTMQPLATPITLTGGAANSPAATTLAASIDWGDGVTSIGKIAPDTTASAIGGYTVTGTHTYAKVGQYKIHILVTSGPTPGPGPQPLSPAAPTPTYPTVIIADIVSLADVTAGTTATGTPTTVA